MPGTITGEKYLVIIQTGDALEPQISLQILNKCPMRQSAPWGTLAQRATCWMLLEREPGCEGYWCYAKQVAVNFRYRSVYL